MNNDFSTEEEKSERKTRETKTKLLHPAVLATIDILLAALLILLFAYIDHGRAYLRNESTYNKDNVVDLNVKEINLTLNSPAANVGQTMTATLAISASDPLSQATIHLAYDSNLLEVQKPFNKGDAFTDTAEFEFSEQTDATGKSIIVLTAKEKNNDGIFKKEGSVFNINFKIKKDVSNGSSIKVIIPDGGLIKKDGKPATSKVKYDDNSSQNNFNGKFTKGEIIETDTSYQSANVNVSWTRHEEEISGKKVVYYLADVYLRSPDLLMTGIADGNSDRVENMAKDKNAIIAINGDYFGARKQGVVVRNGKLIRKDPPFRDILVMYEDGSMETFTKEEFDFDKANAKGIMHAWSFGPMLLDNGKAMTEFNSDVNTYNPRTAIGYYEPGHYCFLSVNGRGEEGSEGIRMEKMSELFEQLGCQVAYNLDGGQTSIMVWDKGEKVINTPVSGGRNCSDMIYIPKE